MHHLDLMHGFQSPQRLNKYFPYEPFLQIGFVLLVIIYFLEDVTLLAELGYNAEAFAWLVDERFSILNYIRVLEASENPHLVNCVFLLLCIQIVELHFLQGINLPITFPFDFEYVWVSSFAYFFQDFEIEQSCRLLSVSWLCQIVGVLLMNSLWWNRVYWVLLKDLHMILLILPKLLPLLYILLLLSIVDLMSLLNRPICKLGLRFFWFSINNRQDAHTSQFVAALKRW